MYLRTFKIDVLTWNIWIWTVYCTKTSMSSSLKNDETKIRSFNWYQYAIDRRKRHQRSQQAFVLKTSWRRLSSCFSEYVFKTSSKRLDWDDYIYLRHTNSEDIIKRCSRRFDHDEYIRLAHASSRCVLDVFKTFFGRLAKASSRNLQDKSKMCSKMSWKDVFKTSSRRFKDVSSS